MYDGFIAGPPWCHGKFRRHGYRMTIPRQLVIETLSKSSGHPSAEDIYFEIHKTHPGIGLTSVYRTLELLVQMGIAFKFDFGDGRSRYELVEGPKGIGHHHHLVCNNCGRIIDYTDFIEDEVELLKRTEEGLSKKFGFKITNHLIQFYGLCDNCK